MVATGVVDGNGDCRQIEDPSDYLCIAPGDEADRADGWADTYAYHGGETESVTSTRTDVYVSALKISKHYSYYDDFNPASQDGPETNTRLANHVWERYSDLAPSRAFWCRRSATLSG